FPPPVLDCQACCKPDGSCTNTVPEACASAGGTSHGSGSDCASTQCCTSTGVTGHCTQTTPCCDSNARCEVDGHCCLPNGAGGCPTVEDCCNFFGSGSTCNAGTCCIAPTGTEIRACQAASDCCGGSCHDFGGSTGCCYELGSDGCTTAEDCCN